MWNPDKVSEADLLDAIARVARVLSPKFVFGSYTTEDIDQQIALFCLEALPRYDATSYPLPNFLYSHCKNRLLNLYRDKCRRNDPPCRGCAQAERPSAAHAGSGFCDAHVAWLARNDAKANLLHPPSIGEVQPFGGTTSSSEIDEAVQLISNELPLELRPDWLRMRSGEAVPKPRREAVERAVAAILAEGEEGDGPAAHQEGDFEA